jgi:hypothetical protein
MYQIGTEQIEFVIQSDEPTHQLVFYPAVHKFIVSILSSILCLTGSSRAANLIATLVAPVLPTTRFGFAIAGQAVARAFLPLFRVKHRGTRALSLKLRQLAL